MAALRKSLEEPGAFSLLSVPLNQETFADLADVEADALVVHLDYSADERIPVMYDLLNNGKIPVLFLDNNDIHRDHGAGLQGTAERLADKITLLVQAN